MPSGVVAVAGLFGRGGRYKLMALTAILLLALWSMLTGWSAVNLNYPSPDLDSPVSLDLDVLVNHSPTALRSVELGHLIC